MLSRLSLGSGETSMYEVLMLLLLMLCQCACYAVAFWLVLQLKD